MTKAEFTKRYKALKAELDKRDYKYEYAFRHRNDNEEARRRFWKFMDRGSNRRDRLEASMRALKTKYMRELIKSIT